MESEVKELFNALAGLSLSNDDRSRMSTDPTAQTVRSSRYMASVARGSAACTTLDHRLIIQFKSIGLQGQPCNRPTVGMMGASWEAP